VLCGRSSEVCTDASVRTIVVDSSTNDGKLGGGVADAVDKAPSSPSVDSAEPVVCNADEAVAKSVGLLPGRPEFPAGTALIPETAPRLDGWKEKAEAEAPVFK
jgi:hypothetical protein